MSILFGVLLYALAIAFLCALTGANRLDGPEPTARTLREKLPSEAATRAGTIPARSVHG
jgi:hypothetical protein